MFICIKFSQVLETHFTFFSFCRTEIVEELGDLSFSMFDGDSVSKWKGKDLKLADNIPNIDLLVIGIEQVEYLLIKL